MKMQRFRVRPKQVFDFPTDMLRYDSCWPATEQDSVELAVATRNVKDWLSIYVTEKHTSIALCGINGPTPARWASFGWEVIK